MTLWIDADAAPRPVKDIVFRAAERRKVDVVVVANRPQQVPRSVRVRFVLVGQGMDVADDHIAAGCAPGDLVITADIPLAALVVAKGVDVLDPRGELLNEANVRQRLSMRDFLEEVRASGQVTGGPPPFDDRAKQRFANALDRWLTLTGR